jgi:GNAT superfamily N-acetyltransferase
MARRELQGTIDTRTCGATFPGGRLHQHQPLSRRNLVGCARAVTDFTRFAYLADVFILPEHRGHGLGRWLVQTMIEHPSVGNVRWVLHTLDAHGLYRQFGFELADEMVMQRPKPG